MSVAIGASAPGARAYPAMDFRGARYLHILVPCPLGRIPPASRDGGPYRR
jgi:hypothetical protein